jgi:hypothetical protein
MRRLSIRATGMALAANVTKRRNFNKTETMKVTRNINIDFPKLSPIEANRVGLKKGAILPKTLKTIWIGWLMNGLLLSVVTLIQDLGLAQPYAIDWYKVSGGGGTSSGGQYIINGTIGQHDAGGPMTGGNYSLMGGFWSLISIVQTPGAPLLVIQWINPTIVNVSWPSPSTGFALQQNSDLKTGTWANYSGTINDDGTTKSVTISPPAGTLFFRLKK